MERMERARIGRSATAHGGRECKSDESEGIGK